LLVERNVEHPRIELLRGRWKNRAACLDSDPEVFFPQRGAGKKQINEAKAIGATCPVLSVCRDYVDVIEANIPVRTSSASSRLSFPPRDGRAGSDARSPSGARARVGADTPVRRKTVAVGDYVTNASLSNAIMRHES
jgi:hypothetical protein